MQPLAMLFSLTVTLHTHLQTAWRGLDFIGEEVEAFKVQGLHGQLASLGPSLVPVYLAETH